MEYNPEDTDVVHLLKKLKETNGEYPQELLVLRRQKYLDQVAAISGATGLAAGIKNSVKSGTGVGFPPAAGTLVEALLVVALIAEAGAVTFFYRDKLVQVFRSITNSPKVEEISPLPILPSPLPGLDLSTPSPVVTQMETFTSSPVVTVTSSQTLPAPGTPSPELAAGTDQPSANEPEETSAGVQSVSTSGPVNNNDHSSVSTPAPKGNNGNHYGQTPLPERTKEPGNTNTNNKDSNNPNPNPNPKKKP
jgi:hypothetical protein